jgi:hypothetical protein
LWICIPHWPRWSVIADANLLFQAGHTTQPLIIEFH